MLFKFIIYFTAAIVIAPPPGRLNTQPGHCLYSYFDRTEKSARVSGVNQCAATKRRLLKI